jgi:hypothetical protein
MVRSMTSSSPRVISWRNWDFGRRAEPGFDEPRRFRDDRAGHRERTGMVTEEAG